MIYKEGQVVICINNPEGDQLRRGAGWSEGLKFTIRKITNSGDIKILWPKPEGNGVFENFVMHASWKDRYQT